LFLPDLKPANELGKLKQPDTELRDTHRQTQKQTHTRK
jgi:hypothetical protein